MNAEERAKAEAEMSTAAGDKSIVVRGAQDVDNEFRYYSKLIKDFMLTMTRTEDKQALLPWINKVANPAYNVALLKTKRNHYFFMICCSAMIDSVEEPFNILPPNLSLPDVFTIAAPQLPPMAWERDQTWREELEGLHKIVKDWEEADAREEDPTKKKMYDPLQILKKCDRHKRVCKQDAEVEGHVGGILDDLFQYYLYLSKPYAAMLARPSDRLRAGKWIQALCKVDKSSCGPMKGRRNDYMMLLGGHLANQDLVGPFEDYPPSVLVPLDKLSLFKPNTQPITDPTHPRVSEFFREVPKPDEGAFAFIAVSGDMYKPKYQ